MEKFRCKLCFRNFANGKALGGHMRSHKMKNCYEEQNGKKIQTFEHDSQPSDDFQSSSSTSEEEEEEDREKEVLCYGLRESPKKSIRFVDPRFFSASGSVVLQDGESETESKMNPNPNPNPNPIFRRSKRIRKTRISVKETEVMKKSKCEKGEKISTNCNEFSDQPLSSISDTPEEDVAHCLMMLSRDTWQRQENEYEEEEEDTEMRNKYEEDDSSEDSGSVKVAKSTKVRGKYICETCNKVFRSYQALGGHRANHKKIKVNLTAEAPPRVAVETGKNGAAVEEKIHECPVCFRVFSSGQALGGHKRSHFMGGGAISANVNSITSPPLLPPPAKPFSRIGETLNIDLNLPAPLDDDYEFSQIMN